MAIIAEYPQTRTEQTDNRSPDCVLICFDRKTKTFLGVLITILAIATLFELNGSSIGAWNQFIDGQKSRLGVLLGRPKSIRSDEWLGTTLEIISQARAHPPFPTVNPQWGAGQVPLIANLPARHWSMLVRPQYWGFFLVDLEHGFSFYWNMKALLLLTGTFLLLMLLTGNNFGISVFGSSWVFFSGFTQWWYSTPAMLPEMIGSAALLFVALHYLVLSRKTWEIAAAGVVSTVCLLNFIFCFYPPFQEPLAYLGIALLIGSLLPRIRRDFSTEKWAIRLSTGGAALLGTGILLLLFYNDAREAIELARHTAYPGARIVTGGDLNLAKVFAGFLGYFISEGHFPLGWGNACEASNFVLLFPIPVASVIWRITHNKKVTPLEWSLIGYISMLLAWMTVRWPVTLAIYSGFALTSGSRALIGMGLASIFLCCIFLANSNEVFPEKRKSKLFIVVPLLAVLVVLAINSDPSEHGFLKPSRLVIICLLACLSTYFLVARRRVAFMICILLPSIGAFGLVNPIAWGLKPVVATKAVEEVSRIVASDPNAGWAVYGHSRMANLLKASGAQVFNGIKVLPAIKSLQLLDPSGANVFVYNRYAHVDLVPTTASTVSFRLASADSYSITIDPKSDRWRELGVRYIALPTESSDVGFLANATLVSQLPDIGLWVYKFREPSP